MAGETLRSAADLLQQFPDNTSGLIQAVDSRDFVVSVTPAVGFYVDQNVATTITIPLVQDWVSINLATLAPVTLPANFWALDNNNAWTPDYGAITVPPGLERLAGIATYMTVAKTSGGTQDPYQFQYRAGGVPIGDVQTELINNVPQTMTVRDEALYQPGLANPIDLWVQGEAAGTDLLITTFRQRIASVML